MNGYLAEFARTVIDHIIPNDELTNYAGEIVYTGYYTGYLKTDKATFKVRWYMDEDGETNLVNFYEV